VKIIVFVFSFGLLALISGCGEKPKNVMMGDTVVKFTSPPGYCLSELGYPLRRDQLGILQKFISENLSVFAIYVPCERRLVSEGYAVVYIKTDQIGKRYSNHVDQFAQNMGKIFHEMKDNEFNEIQKGAVEAITKNDPYIKEVNTKITGVYSDELAAYVSSEGTLMVAGGEKVNVISKVASSLIEGKPLVLMMVYTSLPGQNKPLGVNVIDVESWVESMHDVN